MSPRYHLTGDDLARWLHNLQVFAAPLVLMYCLSVVGRIEASGFSLNTFVLTVQMQGALALYSLNATIDILKKFISFNLYQ